MNLVQLDDIRSMEPLEEWPEYKQDGLRFLEVARNAHEQKKRAFSTDTLYNLICMGIEKLVMAFLMRRGDLAENHTMGDLLRALQKYFIVDPEFVEKLTYLDGFQEICDVDAYNVTTPSNEDILTILTIGEELKSLLAPYLTENV